MVDLRTSLEIVKELVTITQAPDGPAAIETKCQVRAGQAPAGELNRGVHGVSEPVQWRGGVRGGSPVHVVAARLGLDDPAITLRVFAHVLRDQALRAGQSFADLLDGEGQP